MSRPPKVALFVTCLVDLFRPSVGFAALRLLEEAGCDVEVPEAQTCCGQPAFNSGDRKTARDLAMAILDSFAGYDYVVAPSGSCAGMLRRHLAEQFEEGDANLARARELSQRCHELTSFLVDVMGMTSVAARAEIDVTYHDSCSGLRELGIKGQPRQLLLSAGADIVEMDNSEVCCGFGGTFCVKYPDLSTRMVSDKMANIEISGADTVVAGDLGCLLNMAGRLRREGSSVHVRHVAELLVGDLDTPAIGEGS
ncbi:MAG: (Fe-S)-binding protein [Geminicoccaceae bacterium]|nr:(Fe-S)-binding protein [Geminicoccaceae bacterium]MCB9942146.1 (Fe-S)-binding protein [Geminicoccaceae bacterium]